jgi:glycosyltransferase involved in cell wall biosynthesis
MAPTTAPTRSIAVITPAYNAGRYINATLAAIAGQTVPVTEVIIADDGCTDDTIAQTARWSSMLPIHVVTTSGRTGSGPARQLAIEKATADLLVFVDSDDVPFPDLIERLLAAHRGPGWITTASQVIWKPGTKVWELEPMPLGPTTTSQELVEALVVHNFLSVTSMCERLDVVAVGGQRALSTEDYDLWLRMAMNGAKTTIAPDARFLYRRHPDAKSIDPAVGRASALEALDANATALDSFLGAERHAAARRRSDDVDALTEMRRLTDLGDYDGAQRIARTIRRGSFRSSDVTRVVPPMVNKVIRTLQRRIRG